MGTQGRLSAVRRPHSFRIRDLFSEVESSAPEIQARRLQFKEDLPRLLVIDPARQQPCYDLRQSALHGRRILQRRAFKPSLPRTLCLCSRAPRSLTLMRIAVPCPPHRGASAAGGVVHPVLAWRDRGCCDSFLRVVGWVRLRLGSVSANGYAPLPPFCKIFRITDFAVFSWQVLVSKTVISLVLFNHGVTRPRFCLQSAWADSALLLCAGQ